MGIPWQNKNIYLSWGSHEQTQTCICSWDPHEKYMLSFSHGIPMINTSFHGIPIKILFGKWKFKWGFIWIQTSCLDLKKSNHIPRLIDASNKILVFNVSKEMEPPGYRYSSIYVQYLNVHVWGIICISCIICIYHIWYIHI